MSFLRKEVPNDVIILAILAPTMLCIALLFHTIGEWQIALIKVNAYQEENSKNESLFIKSSEQYETTSLLVDGALEHIEKLNIVVAKLQAENEILKEEADFIKTMKEYMERSRVP
jgi:hypothetical protein